MELRKGVLSEAELRVYRQEMLRKKCATRQPSLVNHTGLVALHFAPGGLGRLRSHVLF